MKYGSLAELLGDEVVFRRTTLGQSEAICGRAVSNADERRLLLAVNGFTSLRVLLDMYPADIDHVAALQRLVELKLIEPVDPGSDAAPRRGRTPRAVGPDGRIAPLPPLPGRAP
jgi:hypothetical protein